MTKKERLQLLITGKTPKMLEGFKAFDEGVAELKSKLEENIRVSTLDEVGGKINDFRKKMDFAPLLNAIDQIKQEIRTSDNELRSTLEERLQVLRDESSVSRGTTKDRLTAIAEEISAIEVNLSEVAGRKFPEFPDFTTPIKEAEARLTKMISNSSEEIKKGDQSKALKELIKDLEEELKKLRRELLTRINDKGGGNMNRSIFIGNANAVAKYTDINLKAGSNVTITYVNNDQTKKVDITIASSGGGGGSVRSINSVAVDTTAGDTAGTDYVLLVSGTTTITLPTAVGNTNLYTIKNVGTGVVTIATTGGETIDTNTTITMATQFTSVDLISDTVNWNIT